MKNFLFTIDKYINALFFGKSCLGCKKLSFGICSNCLSNIPLSKPTENNKIYGIYDYGNDIVWKSIWNLKYKSNSQEVKSLILNSISIINEIIAEHLQSEYSQKVIFVPIPQHKKKAKTRGFNQSKLIANFTSENIESSEVKDILVKSIETIPQSHISDKEQRIKNISGAFAIKDEMNLDPKQIYILVDDVTTTGATFLEAVRVMKSFGIKNVLCIALAHGYKRRYKNY